MAIYQSVFDGKAVSVCLQTNDGNGGSDRHLIRPPPKLISLRYPGESVVPIIIVTEIGKRAGNACRTILRNNNDH